MVVYYVDLIILFVYFGKMVGVNEINWVYYLFDLLLRTESNFSSRFKIALAVY